MCELDEMENAREISGQRAKLLFQFVVHDEDGELGALSLALGFRELEEPLLHIFLELRDGISMDGIMISGLREKRICTH
jgi:hypothetical protein